MKTSFYVAVVTTKWLDLFERERVELLSLLVYGFVTYREWNELTIVIDTVDEEMKNAARETFDKFCSLLGLKCGASNVPKRYERTGLYEFDTG